MGIGFPSGFAADVRRTRGAGSLMAVQHMACSSVTALLKTHITVELFLARHTHTHAHMWYRQTHTRRHDCMPKPTQTRTCGSTFIHMHTQTRTLSTHTCGCTHKCTHTHTNTHTHTHTHTHKPLHRGGGTVQSSLIRRSFQKLSFFFNRVEIGVGLN